MKRNRYAGLGLLVIAGTLGVGSILLQRHSVVEAAAVKRRASKWIRCGRSRCRITGSWARPSASRWTRKDHIWIIHRAGSLEAGEMHATTNPPIAQCCAPAPPVLEFDQAGNLIGHWGGPGAGYDWPDSNHGITVDYKGNVWIGGNGRGPRALAAPSMARMKSLLRRARRARLRRSKSFTTTWS